MITLLIAIAVAVAVTVAVVVVFGAAASAPCAIAAFIVSVLSRHLFSLLFFIS